MLIDPHLELEDSKSTSTWWAQHGYYTSHFNYFLKGKSQMFQMRRTEGIEGMDTVQDFPFLILIHIGNDIPSYL